MTFRLATEKDAKKIAELHAQSWQKTYRGSFSDEFLDNHVLENRKAVWQKRFEENENQTTILAEESEELIGFVCIFPKNEQFGALIDNLHVSENYHGQGIGKMLMQKASQWIESNSEVKKMHLYVLEKNANAIIFYEKLGAKINNAEFFTSPDGLQLKVFKMVWNGLI